MKQENKLNYSELKIDHSITFVIILFVFVLFTIVQLSA